MSDPAAAADSKPALLGALHHPNFRLFIGGQLISLIGTWMQTVAQAWLVYRLTGSAALLGLIGFATQIPVFLVSPLGGLVADRFDRRRVVMIAQAAAMLLALTLGVLTLTDTVEVWHIFTMAALLGVVNGFDMPGRHALLPELVPRPDLTTAIALYAAIFNGARLAGPALAGVLVALVGEGWCFVGNGVSYLAVLVALALLRLHPQPRHTSPAPPLTQLREGFGFAGRTWPVRSLLLAAAAVGFGGGPYVALLPIFADRILGGGVHSLGLLMGAAGLGALLGTVLLTTRGYPARLWRWVGRALLGFGGLILLFAMSTQFWLSASLLVGIGFCLLISLTSINTLLQSHLPDHLRGRVMAIFSMTTMGATPLGALAGGLAAEVIGAPMAAAIGGLISLAAGVWFGVEVRRLRQASHSQTLIAGGPPLMIN